MTAPALTLLTALLWKSDISLDATCTSVTNGKQVFSLFQHDTVIKEIVEFNPVFNPILSIRYVSYVSPIVSRSSFLSSLILTSVPLANIDTERVKHSPGPLCRPLGLSLCKTLFL